MTPIELMATHISDSCDMLKMSLADFSDAEMFVRPVPNANHATWQVGHLVSATSSFITALGGSAPQLPAGFREKYNKQTSGIDDPKAFHSKAELMGLFESVHHAAVTFVKSRSLDDLTKPGPEKLRSFAPTEGHVLMMIATHAMMHQGQFSVTRRKLGKPVMF